MEEFILQPNNKLIQIGMETIFVTTADNLKKFFPNSATSRGAVTVLQPRSATNLFVMGPHEIYINEVCKALGYAFGDNVPPIASRNDGFFKCYTDDENKIITAKFYEAIRNAQELRFNSSIFNVYVLDTFNKIMFAFLDSLIEISIKGRGTVDQVGNER
jgi:hypothetical protein